jgi:hypothetical protein
VIKWAEESFNNHLSKFLKDDVPKDRVIMMDTDSCYIGVKDIIDQFNPKYNIAPSKLEFKKISWKEKFDINKIPYPSGWIKTVKP